MDPNRQIQAEFIAEKLDDMEAIRFHLWAIGKLGFGHCSQLAAEVVQLFREGHVRHMGKYYNRCVLNEVKSS